MVDRSKVFRSKVVTKDLGDPKSFGTDRLKKDGRILLGMIGGIANAVSARKTDPKDDTKLSYGLSGSFRAIPADDKLPIVESGLIYLRDEMHGVIASQLRNQPSGTNPEGADNVKFLFNIYLIPASNPAGYTFEHEPLSTGVDGVEVVDPLAIVFQSHAGADKPKQLAAPEKKSKKK